MSQNSPPDPEKRLGHKTRDPNLEKRLGHKTRDPKKGSVTKLATPTSKKGSVTKGHKTRTLIRGKEGRFRFPFLSNFFTFSHGISCRDQSRLSIARPARRSSRSPRARGIAKGRRCAACTVTKNLSFQKRDPIWQPSGREPSCREPSFVGDLLFQKRDARQNEPRPDAVGTI